MLSRIRLPVQRLGGNVRHITAPANAAEVPLNWVDGQRVKSANTDINQQFDVLEPATGKLLCKLQGSGAEDVDRAVKNAKEAFKDWSQLSGFQRGKILYEAARLLKDNIEDFAKVECRDVGKAMWEARMDVTTYVDTLEYFAGIASTVMGQHIQQPNGSFAYTRREPLGVCGAIGAWNYPLMMATWKSAPALACGNTVVIKPSPLTPLATPMLAELYKEAGLPDGCFNVVQGHAETGQLLCKHPLIEKISFTGSVPSGSKVMAAGAEGIKHVTLELGGKSPVIIFEDCDLDNAVKGTMLANYLTQGQVCSNGTRVFVQKSIIKQFLAKLVEKTNNMKIGNPENEDTMVGATISPEQAIKVLGFIERAREEGATVLCGGERVTPEPSLAGGYYLSPCVLYDLHDNMEVVQEEVFGSVVSVLGFDTEEEVVKRANDSQFGLAGGVFTRDLCRAHRVSAQLETGTVYINNFNVYPPEMPFGGFKKSGIGRENGTAVLDYYTQIKTVFVEMGDVDSPYN